jgi:hypothetical protein
MTLLMRAAAFILIVGAAALRGGEEASAPLVPWKIVEPGSTVDEPLVLFWIPASAEELRRSELLTSRDLLRFSARCVAMRVVPGNDVKRVSNLANGEELPMAVLADQDGEILGRVAGAGGWLPPLAVERLVRQALDRRAADADARLDRAREYAEARETQRAIAVYESVWEDRCVCPRQGKDAGRALKKLRR